MLSSSRVCAACRSVAQSDWLPMMIATGLPAMSAPTRRAGRKRKRRIIGRVASLASAAAYYARLCDSSVNERSGDDVGSELVFDETDAVAQLQLAFLQPLNLQDVGAGGIVQRFDRGIEVAVLLPQAGQGRLELAPFLLRHARRSRTPAGRR